MDNPDSSQPPYIDRPPRTLRERLVANSRPQPAIPALLVFVLAVLLPVFSQGPQAGAAGGGVWLTLLVTTGIVASCALAVAAGFCSVFPQAAWFCLAWWCLALPGGPVMPLYNKALLIAGMVASVAMLVYQVWRVRTGRFQPTIREYN